VLTSKIWASTQLSFKQTRYHSLVARTPDMLSLNSANTETEFINFELVAKEVILNHKI